LPAAVLNDKGPAVVTVVNTSHGRAQEDIDRDIEAADLTSMLVVKT